METVQDFLYGLPKPPGKVRTEPLQVICVGLPRSATESLSIGLHKLGLNSYHGWDILFEEDPGYLQEWALLARRKFRGAPDGDVHISRSEFDALLGNAEALVDVGASAFAPQLLEAYPDVKVILNTRRDLNAWHRSAIKALVEDLEDKLYLQVLRLMSAYLFWSWELFVKTGFGGLFQSSSVKQGILRNGKWIYRDHCNMIRGLVPKDRLLEWSVEDGWEPLCKFLDKPLPDEPFPRTNDITAFEKRRDVIVRPRALRAIRKLSLFVGSTAVLATAIGLSVKENGMPWKALGEVRSRLWW